MSKNSIVKIKKCKIIIRGRLIAQVIDYILNFKDRFHEVCRKEMNLA